MTSRTLKDCQIEGAMGLHSRDISPPIDYNAIQEVGSHHGPRETALCIPTVKVLCSPGVGTVCWGHYNLEQFSICITWSV